MIDGDCSVRVFSGDSHVFGVRGYSDLAFLVRALRKDKNYHGGRVHYSLVSSGYCKVTLAVSTSLSRLFAGVQPGYVYDLQVYQGGDIGLLRFEVV